MPESLTGYTDLHSRVVAAPKRPPKFGETINFEEALRTSKLQERIPEQTQQIDHLESSLIT